MSIQSHNKYSNAIDIHKKGLEDKVNYQKSQSRLCYATISSLPQSETLQELKILSLKTKIIPEGIVNKNVEIFQKYINQRCQNNKNSFL